MKYARTAFSRAPLCSDILYVRPLLRVLGTSSGASGVNQAKERYESSTNCLCIARRLNGAGNMHIHLYGITLEKVDLKPE